MPVREAAVELLPDCRAIVAGARLDGAGGGVHEHVYAATGRPTTTVPLAGPAEVDAAVEAARAAVGRWRRLPASERRAALARFSACVAADAERLAGLQTLESGMPERFARAIPAAAADFLTYYAGWSDKLGGEVIETWPMRALDYALDEPYGVVAAIVPWNGALASLAQVAGAALAAGNAVVLKPPELAPFTSLRVGELAEAAALPSGVLNVLPGGPQAGEALVRHAGVDKVQFTGSARTARRVLHAAHERLTPVALELGGKSAHLVFADADLRAAARWALSGLVIASGQGCANGTRVLVEASVYEEVLERVLAGARRLAVGDPRAPVTTLGPVVSARACARIRAFVRRAERERQGRLVTGGERLGGELAGGFFLDPAVFADVDPASPLAQEEIFGPVLALTPFADEREGVRIANATRYGLAAYVHTSDVRRAHRVAHALRVGNVWVNGFYGIPPSMPFGGRGESGGGRTGGRLGLHEFLRPRNVWLGL